MSNEDERDDYPPIVGSLWLVDAPVAGQVDRSECVVRNCWEQWTREGTHARKTGPGTTGRPVERIEGSCGKHAGPSVTRSTIRVDVAVAVVPQLISRHLAEANLTKRPFRALHL
ncbi:HTH_Tnp_Tc3_2 domain-containing protein [Trichonephila clavipes]|nr:HTH_Tnp_Tc3_2 domain-containing protein [Trichonephila clavipes]